MKKAAANVMVADMPNADVECKSLEWAIAV